MRMSFAVLSVSEQTSINISVHDMLQGIKVLADFAKKEGDETEYMVTFHWSRDSEGLYQLESETTKYFRVVSDNEIPLALGSPILSGCWEPPEGCKLLDCVRLLYTEVATLAFAMTNGAVKPWGDISEEHLNIVLTEDKKEFTLKFSCCIT